MLTDFTQSTLSVFSASSVNMVLRIQTKKRDLIDIRVKVKVDFRHFTFRWKMVAFQTFDNVEVRKFRKRKPIN